MNQKKCKQLRKQARILGDHSRDYLAKKITNILGHPKIIVINDPESVRGIYRQMKRDYRNGN